MLCLLFALTAAARPVDAQTLRVSVASDGSQGNAGSIESTISADGRFIAFWSRAGNLVPGDTNSVDDTFVHDRTTATTTRVSVSSTGTQANSHVLGRPVISDDGRFVAFRSSASNLVPGDTNGTEDVFVHDRATAQTTRVSMSSAGVQGNSTSGEPAISGDGRFVAFTSTANNLVPPDLQPCCQDVYLHDRATGETTRLSLGVSGARGNAKSYVPMINRDGQVVTFVSAASNLVPNDTNAAEDVFVHDRATGLTTRVNLSSTEDQANAGAPGLTDTPALSDDGRFVLFRSDATNLVAGDTNGRVDVFLHDRSNGQTTRVSISSAGVPSNGDSGEPALSGDGRVVAFNSLGSNLVAGDTNGVSDGFVHDRVTGLTTRVNVSNTGAQSAGALSLDLTTDGGIVSFAGSANGLVPDDTNGDWDVFVRVRGAIGSLPGAPTNLTATVVGSSVTLAWGLAATGAAATSYVLEVGSTPGASDLVNQDVGAARTLTGVAPGGLYHVRVRGRNAAGTGPPSNEVVVQVGVVCTPPGPPGALSASVAGFVVTLTWSAGAGTPGTFLIEAGSTPGATDIARVDVGATTQLAAGAPPGTYYVRVRASNACGMSAPSNEVTVVVDPSCSVPGPPGSLAASLSGSTVTLTWTASTGSPTSYVVEAGTAPGGSNVATVDTGGTALQLSGTAPSGTYFVRLRARNTCGVGTASNEITIIVP